jgi:phenylacetate-coenzyme A ligase PaaK-like adenylate-forming protein
MSDTRSKWLQTVLKYKLNPDKAGSATVWCPDLEQVPRQRLKEIQSDKLVAAFSYLYEQSPFYNEKFTKAGLHPGDITSVHDLHKIPITTKHSKIRLTIRHGEHFPLFLKIAGQAKGG